MQETAVDSTICSPYWRDANTASILTPCWIIGQQTIAERNWSSIRMYILMLDDWKLSRMKQTKDVRMYIEEYLF